MREQVRERAMALEAREGACDAAHACVSWSYCIAMQYMPSHHTSRCARCATCACSLSRPRKALSTPERGERKEKRGGERKEGSEKRRQKTKRAKRTEDRKDKRMETRERASGNTRDHCETHSLRHTLHSLIPTRTHCDTHASHDAVIPTHTCAGALSHPSHP